MGYVDIDPSGGSGSAGVTSLNSLTGDLTIAAGTGIVVTPSGDNIIISTTSSGGVTSVGLADGSLTPIYTISGSPVTSSGTLTFSLNTQSANAVFVGPSSGSAAQPTFRSLVANDIPDLSSLYLPLTGGSVSGNIVMTSSAIVTGLPSPINPTDAVNKAYVDAIGAGLIWINPVNDMCLADDSLSTPPVSPRASVVYIIDTSPTGAWTSFGAGHAVWWNNETSEWIDLFPTRTVQSGDRFIIDHDASRSPSLVGGSFTGYTNYICTVTGGSPGAWTYSFIAAVDSNSTSVTNQYSDHYGQSYVYQTSDGTWIQFSGPGSTQVGAALAYSSNVLNVLFDNASINVNGSNQLQVIGVGGSSASAVNSATILANAATSTDTASTIVYRDSSGNFAAGTITASLTGNVTGNVSGSAASFTGSLAGDVAGTQSATVIQPGVVTNSKLAVMNNNTVKGNTSGGSTNPSDLSLGTATESTSSVLTLTGWTNATIGSPTIQVKQATTSQSGYLSSTDWNTFNNKQSTLTFSDSIVNTSGTITLVNDSASPGNSYYYGTNSGGTLGYFALPSSSGANTTLSNLGTTSINSSLIPNANNTLDIGSSADEWANGWFGTKVYTPALTTNTTGGTVTITGGTAASSGNGGAVTLNGAAGSSVTTGGNGGAVNLNGGTANGTNNNTGGAINLQAGNSIESGTGGTVTISSGNGGTGSGTAGATGGTTNVNGGTGGAGSSTSGNGGGATLKGGSGGGGVAGGQGGTAQLTGGTGGTGSASGGNGGAANVQGGSPGSFAGAQGGSVTVASANGTNTGNGGAGGTVTISTGQANGDNTTNYSGGSLTMSVGHSVGSSGGSNITMTAGTGGVGTGTSGANGGNATFNAGTGGLGSSTGGNGGSLILNAGAGGNSTTPGTGGIIQFFTGSTGAGQTLSEHFRISASNTVYATNSQLQVVTSGYGLSIAHGSNCKLGTSTMTSGSVVVSNTAVTSNSAIFLTIQSPGGTVGSVYISAKTAGTSFTITSTSGSDTSTVAWLIIEQI